MGKEVKIGLTVIAMLLVVLAVVLVRRMTHAPQLPGLDVAKQNVKSSLAGAGKGNQAQSPKSATLLPLSTESAQRGKSSDSTHRANGWQQTAKKPTSASKSNKLRLTQDRRQTTTSGDNRYTNTDRGSLPSIYGDDSSTGRDSGRRYGQHGTSSVARAGDRSVPRRPTPNLYGEDVERWGEKSTQSHQTFRRPYDDPAVQQEQAPTPPQQQQASAAYSAMQQRQVYSNTSRKAAQRLPAGPTAYARHGVSPASVKEPVARRENTGKYYVEPGDSFWKISQKIYGDGGYFKALQAYNRVRYPVPGKLDIGDEILTPRAVELQGKYAHLCPKKRKAKPGIPIVSTVSTSGLRPGRSYVVEEGDTLYDIARYELGSGSRWPEIYQLNQGRLGRDMDYLRPGMELDLPASPTAAAEQFAEQPGSTTWK